MMRRSDEISRDQYPKIMPSEAQRIKLTEDFLRPAYAGTCLEYLSSQFKKAHPSR